MTDRKKSEYRNMHLRYGKLKFSFFELAAGHRVAVKVDRDP